MMETTNQRIVDGQHINNKIIIGEFKMEFIDEYHKLYEKARIWEDTTWMGIPCYKWPPDAFIIQELIFKLEPDFVIETGTGKGGSAFFYASICELMGQGKVITVDIEARVDHDLISKYEWSDRIKFLHGSSTNSIVLKKINKEIGNTKRNIVILDSYHSCSHVLQELGAYEAFVGKGFMIIVEDTHAGNPGHPVTWEYDDGGAYEAVKFFLKENDDFEVDWNCERHLMTFNPSGYLVRKK
jgi:cephalosporin hydroxylase